MSRATAQDKEVQLAIRRLERQMEEIQMAIAELQNMMSGVMRARNTAADEEPALTSGTALTTAHKR